MPSGAGGTTPVTVVAGPRRAARTALLRHWLEDPRGRDAIALTAGAMLGAAAERAVALRDGPPLPAAGCTCCTVSGGLRHALRSLLVRARLGQIGRVFVEAAGTDDPDHIAATIASDPALAAVFHLDRLVFAADATGSPAAWQGDAATARLAASADGIVVLGGTATPALRQILAALNPTAPLFTAPPPVDFPTAASRLSASRHPHPAG